MTIGRLATEADMRAVGKYILAVQARRIARGEGSTGRKMKRYSKAYRKARAAAGLPTDIRTLRLTGSMLEGRSVTEVDNRKARIGFPGAPRYFHINQARTPFVKATDEEMGLARAFLRRVIRERVRKDLASARGGGAR